MHAVEHLTLRISHLHDIIHYPSPEDLCQQLTDLKQQMEKKEHALAKVQWRMDVGAETMYECVDEAVDVVEKSMWRHKKKCEKQDQKVKDINFCGKHKSFITLRHAACMACLESTASICDKTVCCAIWITGVLGTDNLVVDLSFLEDGATSQDTSSIM
ncbi:hypothetical protein EDD18DRAFT_1428238 [Armillaria luteobubalina]|uniref:Uncharacterized protein n=1 Tax=Armillaria luteobubalina TaxID=153913 RepID=A0AA39PJW3_9AGAR|nr:hypothetical protein EDD18DRAFT_1428238 [Armillaria luteobubalina]